MKLSVAALFSLASMATLVLGAPASEISSRHALAVERGETTCPGCTSKADEVEIAERNTVVDMVVERSKTTCPGCYKAAEDVTVVERAPVPQLIETDTCHGCGTIG